MDETVRGKKDSLGRDKRLRRQATQSQLYEDSPILPSSPPSDPIVPYHSQPSPPASPLLKRSVRARWRKAFYKIKAQRAMERMNVEMLNFGTNELLDGDKGYRSNLDELLERKIQKKERFRAANNEPSYISVRKKGLFYPDSVFRQVWSSLLTIMMAYIATVIPFRVAFTEDVFFDGWTIFDFCLDGLFCADIFVNFFSCYQNSSGQVIDNRCQIALYYVKTWFLVDLVSSFPFSVIDLFVGQTNQSGQFNKFMKLTRLPRLYKLFRLAKLIRFLKVYENTPFYDKVQDCCQQSSRLTKLLKFGVLVSLCVHFMACVWYFSARVNEFAPDTWVVRYGFVDEPLLYQYLASFYWTVTTTVTVGYGDISARTELEMSLAICWMLIGVGFYSFTIGSLSSFLISIDTKDSILASKMAAINEFANQTGISHPTKVRVREAVRYNTEKTGTVWSDKHTLFDDIPSGLQYEVALSMYGGVIRDLHFFTNRGRSFVLFFIPIMKPMVMFDEDFLYKEGDFADEVFFIAKGRVNLVLYPQEVSYKSYLRGSYIGEIEVVKMIRRIDNAVAYGETELLSVTKGEFEAAMEHFPVEAKEIRRMASERYKRHRRAMLEILALLRIKKQRGSLRNLHVNDFLVNIKEPEDTELTTSEYLKKVLHIEKQGEETKNTLAELMSRMQTLQEAVQRISERSTVPI